jgi:hypothetical protein
MDRFLTLASLIVSLGLMSSCGNSNAHPSREVSETSGAEQEGDLETKLEKLVKKVDEMKRDITRLGKTSVSFNLRNGRSGEYQVLNSLSGYGTFLVHVGTFQPCSDGYKVTFWIGNPTFATLSGLNIILEWNRPLKLDAEDFIKEFNGWLASRKSQEWNIVKDFPCGGWSSVELLLSPMSSLKWSEKVGQFLTKIRWETRLFCEKRAVSQCDLKHSRKRDRWLNMFSPF